MSADQLKRFDYFSRLSEIVKDVDGTFVECGVAYGTSLLMLAVLAQKTNPSRQVWGFDSFAGFPSPSGHDKAPGFDPDWIGKVHYADASPEAVLRLLGVHRVSTRHVRLVKGFFSEGLRKYEGGSIALLHIDADLYDSYRTVLESLWREVAPGGVVAFDDLPPDDYAYDSSRKFPGPQGAVEEFFGEEIKQIVQDPYAKRHYVVEH